MGVLIKNAMTVGNHRPKPNNMVLFEQVLPIQAETGELLYLPTEDLVEVNADKLHKNLDSKEVTDIVPENSYVLSDHKSMRIDKKIADEIITEVQVDPYLIKGKSKKPFYKTLGDKMNSKLMTPAQLAKSLIQEYNTVEGGDIFTEETNRQNKMARSVYMGSVIAISEMLKNKQGKGDIIEEPTPSVEDINFSFKMGGRPLKMKNDYYTKQAGGIVSGIAALLGTGATLYGDYRNRKLIKDNTRDSLFDISGLQSSLLGNNAASTGVNLAGFALQNPNINPVIKSSSYLDQIPTRAPQQFLDYNMSRLYNQRPDTSNYSPQVAAILNDRFYAQAQEAQSNLSLGVAQDSTNRLTAYLQAKQQIENDNEASRTNAGNLTTANSNNLLAGSAGALSAGISDRSNILTNMLQSRLAARGQNTAGLIQLNSNLTQSLQNNMNAGLQAYNSYLASQQKSNTNQQGSGFIPSTPNFSPPYRPFENYTTNLGNYDIRDNMFKKK